MIYDSLKNLSLYRDLHPRFSRAFDFLETFLSKKPSAGRYDPDQPTDEFFINVGEYSPKSVEKAEFEAHERYIDVQCVLEGTEHLYMPNAAAPLPKITTPYSEKNDCALFQMTDPQNCTVLDFSFGTFAIIFPKELHAPGIAKDQTETFVRKIVLKIKMD